jgi:hypothetical protein
MNRQVFINCPFSFDYQEFFRAIVFTTVRSGFEPRCALETDDGSENRFDKICTIISQCRFGIHDISKTEPDAHSGLPRFNMPLELGLFLAAKKFGRPEQKTKVCMILDRDPYRYQKFMSDISGQDIHHHDGRVDVLIEKCAAWFRSHAANSKVPGGRAIAKDYAAFSAKLPAMCGFRHLDPAELTFQDYCKLAAEWIVAGGLARRIAPGQ